MRSAALAFGVCLVTALAAAPLHGQQRRVVTGIAKDAEGAPLAGADVRFVFVMRGAECGEPTDDRTVRTGPDGRFRAELLPCAPYRVWCLGAPGPDGARAASELRLVGSSPVLDLEARRHSRPHELRIEGLEAWAGSSPFHVRVLPAGIQLTEAPIPILDARAAIEALPVVSQPTSPAVALHLLDRRGEVLAAWRPDPEAHAWTWQLPAPTSLQVRVVDNDGEGIAAAAVYERTSTIDQEHSILTISPPIREDWRLLGQSDEHGWLRDALATSPQPDWCVRGAEGSEMTATDAWDRRRFTEVRGDVHTLRLVKKEQPQLQLTTSVPSVAANRTLFASSMRFRSTLRTDDHGMASLLSVEAAIAADHDRAWCQLLPERLRDKAPTPPVAFSVLLKGRPVLHPSWLVELELTTISGGPPTQAQVVLGSHGHVSPWSWHAIPDQAGRLAVIATKDEWLVFAHDEESACTHRIEKAPAAPIRLVLQPLPRMRGRVFDERDQPVAGATMEFVRIDDRDETLPDLEPGLRQIALWRNPDAIARCTSAADGSFDCRFLQDPYCRWMVRFCSGAKTSRTFGLEAVDGFVAKVY